MLHKTLSDVWSTPRAEESQICVQGNLEADKKDFSVPRVCHLHFSHIELLKVHTAEFMVAIGLLKGSKRIRSPPIVFASKVHTLNLTFSFQYYHNLKVSSFFHSCAHKSKTIYLLIMKSGASRTEHYSNNASTKSKKAT